MAQLADLEAALDLPIVPAPVHVSTAREHVQLANQPRLRVKRKQKDPPAPRNRALGQEEQFFATLQAGLEDGSRSYCLFLCWEHAADDQRAVPLLIEDPEDETRVYRDMVTTWDQRRGWWLKYIPFYQVLGVEEVQFRFLRKQDNDYCVIIERLNISSIKARRASELEHDNDIVARMEGPGDFEMRCYEDNSTGKWVHEHRACLAATEYDCLCVYQSQQEDERKLDHLKLLSLPLLCFRDPEFAADQRTLQGLAQETCIYRTSEIKGTSYFKPRVAEANFRGIMPICGFQWRSMALAVPAVALMIVTLWKASGGSWEAAFAAGSFFIMLVSILPMICK